MSLIFTRNAIQDFREIFPDLAKDAAKILAETAEGAVLIRTKRSGSQVYRARKTKHYLLVKDGKVLAVGQPSAAHAMPANRPGLSHQESLYWWNPEPGDIETDRPPSEDKSYRITEAHPLVARLYHICRAAGVSQSWVAERLGISRGTWQGLRTGRGHPPHADLCKKIEDLLTKPPSTWGYTTHGGPREGAGRPTGTGDEGASINYTFRVSESMRAEIIARGGGAWLREIITRELDSLGSRVTPATMDELFEEIGDNLGGVQRKRNPGP